MSETGDLTADQDSGGSHSVAGALLRSVTIGLIAFLTVVDLFATQAILPSLVRAYGVEPSRHELRRQRQHDRHGRRRPRRRSCSSPYVNRRHGIWISLALLTIPTALLALQPDLTTFTLLRIVQGLSCRRPSR